MNFCDFYDHGSQVSAAGKLAYTAILVGRLLLIVLVTLLFLMRSRLVGGKLHVLMHG